MRREISAVDQLHAEVMMAFVLADLVDRHDVRMIQVRRGLRFHPEPLEILGRRESAGPDHLQRQDAVQADLPGLVDDPHTALGEDLEQLVVAEVSDPLPGISRGVRVEVGRVGFSIQCRLIRPTRSVEWNDRGSRMGRRARRVVRTRAIDPIERGPMVSERGREVIEVVAIGEEGSQLGREVGMPRQQLRTVRCSAGLELSR